MWIAIAVLFTIIISAIIYLKIPGSKTKSDFQNTVNGMISKAPEYGEVFTEKDIENLPLPVQKYFRYCGFLGTPKMSYMKATFKDVDFILGDKKVKIDYTQYNFVEMPERIAYINSSMYGIPFEGLDSYKNGAGSMRGTLAKVITLFDQRGGSMDKSSLVTILAECLLIPNVALQDYIEWEPMDDTHAKATIFCYGISASGVFTFDDAGQMLSFITSDRVATETDGTERNAEWSAIVSNYETVNGIKQPKVLQSIWHFPEGDLIYFNENNSEVEIEFR